MPPFALTPVVEVTLIAGALYFLTGSMPFGLWTAAALSAGFFYGWALAKARFE